MKKIIRILPFLLVLIFVLLLLIFPESCRRGAGNGLMLCGNVIIPSLFPFAVCVLFIMRSGVLGVLKKIEPATRLLFGQSCEEFTVFILSLLGGYPVGGRLLRELYDGGRTDRQRVHILQCCCTNAGPAFMVIAVGSGLLGSKELGYILLAASVMSTVCLALLCGILLKKHPFSGKSAPACALSTADNFVSSAADSAASVFSICGYVILFSTVNAYLKELSAAVPQIEYLQYITEVTTGVTLTKNVYIIAFMMGFSGLCVWFQLFSVSGSAGVKLPIFALSRLLHGLFSTVFTFLLVRLFDPSINTLSNNSDYSASALFDTPALAAALVCMGILFLISVFSEKRGGNLLKDMI